MLASDISYHIAVKTGEVAGGSSDSNVFVKLYGEKGDSSKTMLVVSSNDLGNYFESGRVDIFTVETYDIGQVWLSGSLHIISQTYTIVTVQFFLATHQSSYFFVLLV